MLFRSKKGDLLVKIKPDFYTAALNQATANFKSSEASRSMAEATLRKAESEFKRNEDLIRHKLVGFRVR